MARCLAEARPKADRLLAKEALHAQVTDRKIFAAA
jgi:hypothetical protein